MIILYFLLIIPCVTSLSFNLSKIVTEHQNVNITTYQDAYVSSDGIQVTPALQQKAGKATYVELLHLWDNYSKEITNFSTHFTFVIDSDGSTAYGDGMTFFLAPEGSNTTAGGAMGLPIDPNTIQPTSPFVAVEFDTFQNGDWDPVDITPVTHVGISINSLRSNVTKVWFSNITAGLTNECWIDYDSGSKNLSVVFTGFRNGSRVLSSLSLLVDLREILPEKVSFGFSAATGALFEKHTVKSWDFSSTLQN